MDVFLWIIYPYITLTLLVVGLFFRYSTDPMGWTSKSSELLEKRQLRLASPLFHWGILAVFAGHVAGLLIPKAFYTAIGVGNEAYHFVAVAGGRVTGTLALIGLFLLLVRRLSVRRVLLSTSTSDLVALLALVVTVGLGMGITGVYDWLHGAYHYRSTIGPWIRSILVLHPDIALMRGVPVIFKIHIVAAFTLFAISPFTRLVHIWSFPFGYLRRAPIQYRIRYGLRRVRRKQGLDPDPQ